MVLAILGGRKTQTRRVVKPQPNEAWSIPPTEVIDGYYMSHGCRSDVKCPYGVPGDRLWVRETFDFGTAPCNHTDRGCAWYVADGLPTGKLHPDSPKDSESWCREWIRKPSIFMPRWASRITLEITGVKVERVQKITDEDARAEGVTCAVPDVELLGEYRVGYKALWDSLNAKRGYGWDKNPWVWVIEFKRV